MSNQLMTPDSAPRDAAALASQGPFIHRRLGEALQGLGFSCWQNEREKSAFVTASPADRAQALLTQLQAYDASRGGGAAPAPAPAAAPPPQAAPAPAATPAASGRAPRTASAAATNGAGAAGVGNVVELLNALKDVGGKLDAATAQLGQPAQAGELEGLKAMMSAMMQIQRVEVGLLCLLGENVLGAATTDFIGEAVGYGASALSGLPGDEGKG